MSPSRRTRGRRTTTSLKKTSEHVIRDPEETLENPGPNQFLAADLGIWENPLCLVSCADLLDELSTDGIVVAFQEVYEQFGALHGEMEGKPERGGGTLAKGYSKDPEQSESEIIEIGAIAGCTFPVCIIITPQEVLLMGFKMSDLEIAERKVRQQCNILSVEANERYRLWSDSARRILNPQTRPDVDRLSELVTDLLSQEELPSWTYGSEAVRRSFLTPDEERLWALFRDGLLVGQATVGELF